MLAAAADTPIELWLLDQQRDRLSAAEAQGRDAALGFTFRHRRDFVGYDGARRSASTKVAPRVPRSKRRSPPAPRAASRKLASPVPLAGDPLVENPRSKRRGTR